MRNVEGPVVGALPVSSAVRSALLHLDGRALLLQLLPHLLGLGLGDLLLDRLRRAVDQVLGLLEAETRQLAHDLDDLDLLFAGGGEDHVELRLLLRGRGPGAGSTRPSTNPALTWSCWLVLPNVCSVLATATGSCVEKTIAVGPLRCDDRPPSGEPAIASFAIRFFTTRHSADAPRSCL